MNDGNQALRLDIKQLHITIGESDGDAGFRVVSIKMPLAATPDLGHLLTKPSLFSDCRQTEPEGRVQFQCKFAHA